MNVVQGKEYEFRVIAHNKAGASEPSKPSAGVIAKDPYGKFWDVFGSIKNTPSLRGVAVLKVDVTI